MMIRQGPPAHLNCRCITIYGDYGMLLDISVDKDRIDEAIDEWDRIHSADGAEVQPLTGGELIARGLRGSQNVA